MKTRHFILIFCLIPSVVVSQSWQIRSDFLISPEGLFSPFEKVADNSLAGASLSVQNLHKLSEQLDVYAGIEFQGNSIANHILIKLGSRYKFRLKEKHFLSLNFEIGNGAALFNQRLLYSFNSSILFYWNYITQKKNVWSIGPGLQYFSTPGYSTYSKRYQFFTIPISLKYSF